MALVDDLPKLALAVLLAALGAFALWGLFDSRSRAAGLVRRIFSGRSRRIAWAIIGLMVFGVLAEDVLFEEHDEWILQLDHWLMGASVATPAMHRAASAVSRLTGEGLALVVTVATVGLAATSRLREACTVLGGTLSAWGLSALLKLAFGVPRPRVHEPSGVLGNYGFPSGHALVTLVACGLIAWALGRRASRPARIALLLGAWVAAILAGVARVLLNAHWPSDVAAGLAIGAAWLQFVMAIAEQPLVAANIALSSHAGEDVVEAP